MKLSKLFDYYAPIEFTGDSEVEVTGIATHSAEVEPGKIFFALKGEKSHGRQFIKDALEKGAMAVVSHERIGEIEASQIIVSDPRTALSRWSAGFYGFPAKQMKVIGVTGTNGKTTVSNLIYRILLEEGKAGLIGTSGYFYDGTKGKFSMTTPHAHELHFLFRKMADQGIENVVMEVSSHALELGRVLDIEFDSAIFTNLTQDHLDFHKTMENYYASKLKLFGLVKYRARESAVINLDDSYGARMVRDIGFTAATYGLNSPADYRASIKNISMDGSRFMLSTPLGEKEVKVGLIGKFNVYNCLAAIAWGIEGGRNMEVTCQIVSKVSPVPGRLEIVKKGNGEDKLVVIDYAHTPDALENVLMTLKSTHKGRLICVFGCGGDRDREKRPLMGKIAGIFADEVYLTSDNPRTEDPMSILLDIELGIKDTATAYFVIPEREEAISKAVSRGRAGDCILIAGKGDEEYQIIGDHKMPFSDRVIALKYL